jgi:SAM-dependent methyltransferase
MQVFGAYSRYYNLLYRDKDYQGEAAYVRSLIDRYSPQAVSVLDLGCGTGRHDLLLAQMGYRVTGVDRSEEMLAVAKASPALSSPSMPPQQATPAPLSLDFAQGDLQSVRLGREFDAVVSLFHVISYQTTNEALAAAMATVRAHLKPGGIFIFDCWYGPAVLTERPAVRVKRMADDAVAITRLAEPVMHPNENLVEVNYHIFQRDLATGAVAELKESHLMRYLFKPEIEQLLKQAGLTLIGSEEWMTGREAGFDSWGVCFVVRG